MGLPLTILGCNGRIGWATMVINIYGDDGYNGILRLNGDKNSWKKLKDVKLRLEI